ncbi:hypothetical protein GCM10007304_06840 [Rhodococcoides trifolii]|uniref:DUF2505 domain-containing protein n=1 Tax=Rhodococcoides trifolii TaxID=908250 RepID=A0A917CPZ4_9NOCA|nr:DUF2505 domain-containing protein [Rhodococcus trifolii]GGF95600.1 hypothetical protein GCM10007304_06840 [Rhodococcus trifolii]
MPRKFDHTASSTHSVSAVHAAFTSEQYWKDRTEAVGGPNAELTSVTVEGDDPDTRTVRIELKQAIAEDLLPSAITAIRPGDLIINRIESWGSVDARGSAGTFEANVEGAPAGLRGTLTLSSKGNGSTFTTNGAAEVKVPIFGGKIESAVIEQVLQLIDAEHEFTEEWVGKH